MLEVSIQLGQEVPRVACSACLAILSQSGNDGASPRPQIYAVTYDSYIS